VRLFNASTERPALDLHGPGVRAGNLDDDRPRATPLFLERNGSPQWLMVSAGGHWRGGAAEADVVSVEQTAEGRRTRTAKAFADAHGWKSDPGRVGLPDAPPR
jgi:hypothetical protein